MQMKAGQDLYVRKTRIQDETGGGGGVSTGGAKVNTTWKILTGALKRLKHTTDGADGNVSRFAAVLPSSRYSEELII